MPSRTAKAGLSALALATALALGGAAFAEGNGFKFGDARLHPFLDIEGRYDSAAFVANTGGGSSSTIVGDLILHFRPGLKLDIPSPMFALTLNGNVEYLLYTGVVNSGTRNLSHVAADADLDIGVNREGQFGVDIGDHFSRTDRVTSNPSIQSGYLSLTNDARLKLNIRPYAGAITISPGYHFIVDTFSCIMSGDPLCNDTLANSQNYMDHHITLEGRWKFLPKTAMIIDGEYGIRGYFENGGTDSGTGLMTLKASLGLAGLITTHFEVLLKLGWGQDFTTNSFSSLIAQAELAYLFSETASIRGGYVRTFQPMGPPYVLFGDDRGYLEGKLLLGGKLNLHGTVAFDWYVFHPQRAETGVVEKTQASLSVDVGADYEIFSWFNIGAGYRLGFLAGNQVYANLNTFARNEGYLKVEFIY